MPKKLSQSLSAERDKLQLISDILSHPPLLAVSLWHRLRVHLGLRSFPDLVQSPLMDASLSSKDKEDDLAITAANTVATMTTCGTPRNELQECVRLVVHHENRGL